MSYILPILRCQMMDAFFCPPTLRRGLPLICVNLRQFPLISVKLVQTPGNSTVNFQNPSFPVRTDQKEAFIIWSSWQGKEYLWFELRGKVRAHKDGDRSQNFCGLIGVCLHGVMDRRGAAKIERWRSDKGRLN